MRKIFIFNFKTNCLILFVFYWEMGHVYQVKFPHQWFSSTDSGNMIFFVYFFWVLNNFLHQVLFIYGFSWVSLLWFFQLIFCSHLLFNRFFISQLCILWSYLGVLFFRRILFFVLRSLGQFLKFVIYRNY